MYIYLTSSGSKTFFSDNEPSSFRIKLSRPLIFSGLWEIALTQLTIPTFKTGYSPQYIDIYTSSSSESLLNDTEAQILNRVFLSEIATQQCLRFTRPHYIHLNTGQLNLLDIHLLDDTGTKPSFASGDLYCTLHLRRCLS